MIKQLCSICKLENVTQKCDHPDFPHLLVPIVGAYYWKICIAFKLGTSYYIEQFQQLISISK